jgi:aryl-alcohol dehydrogenase-like predicted oxidoreductase
MPTRRQFVQQSSLLAAMAGLAPLLPASAFAADGLLMRSIPSSGERLPVIGLGTSQTFNVDPGSGEMTELLEVMKTFVDGGARLIDTAPSYGDAEAVSGELVKRAGARDKVFLATKVSSTGREAGQRQIEASFKALQSEKIDLIQVHNLQDTKTQLALLRELKEQGRIRYIGITHYVESAHDDLIAVLQKEKVDFVQFNYSVAARNAEKRLLPFCAEHGIATLINRTYGAGQLFARVKGKALPGWAVAELDAGSWAQLMLKFVLADPAVTVVIPATSNPRYMADNLLAGQGRLPDAKQREQIAAEFA